MAEFTLNGSTYRTGKLNAFAQWGIARRLAPALVDLVDARDAFLTPGQFDAALRSAAKALGAISDADSRHIFDACLEVSQRQVGNQWAAVALPGGKLLYEDISLPEILTITVRTVMDNLQGFIAALPSDLLSEMRANTSPST